MEGALPPFAVMINPLPLSRESRFAGRPGAACGQEAIEAAPGRQADVKAEVVDRVAAGLPPGDVPLGLAVEAPAAVDAAPGTCLRRPVHSHGARPCGRQRGNWRPPQSCRAIGTQRRRPGCRPPPDQGGRLTGNRHELGKEWALGGAEFHVLPLEFTGLRNELIVSFRMPRNVDSSRVFASIVGCAARAPETHPSGGDRRASAGFAGALAAQAS